MTSELQPGQVWVRAIVTMHFANGVGIKVEDIDGSETGLVVSAADVVVPAAVAPDSGHVDLTICPATGEAHRWGEDGECTDCPAWFVPVAAAPAGDEWPDDHMLEAAWGLIANAYDGDWSKGEATGWRKAAEKWRDAYHRQLSADHSGAAAPVTEEER